MKLLKIALLLSIFSLMFSCKSKQKTSEAMNSQAVAEKTSAEQSERRGQRGRGQQSPEELKKRQEEMFAQLNLSEAQKVKVETITAKYREQSRQLIQNSGGNRQAIREELKKIRATQLSDLQTVLTTEQFEKYKSITEKVRKGRPGRGGRQNK